MLVEALWNVPFSIRRTLQCLCLSDLGTSEQPAQYPHGKPSLLIKEKWQKVTVSKAL